MLFSMAGLVGKISGDSFKIESVGPISSTTPSGIMFAESFSAPGASRLLMATIFAIMPWFRWPTFCGIILDFPTPLVATPLLDTRLAAGVGTLELLVLIPDIAWLVCRVNIDRQK
jgi:hypothetical protein